jgi:hypothetical protein
MPRWEIRVGADHRRGAGCARPLAMGTVQPSGVHHYVDREPRLERRDRDSRRLLIAVELAILVVSVAFAGLVSLKLATPSLLLATTFLLGVGGALNLGALLEGVRLLTVDANDI